MIKKTDLVKLIIIVLPAINTSLAIAQEGIPVSGGNIIGATGSVSYTLCYIDNSPQKGNNGSVSPGVLQPYEISVITGLPETNNISVFYSVYPNPVSDFLTLKITADFIQKAGNLKYILFDIQGNLIMGRNITKSEMSIPMNELVPSIYILKVTQTITKETVAVKTFKIIKK